MNVIKISKLSFKIIIALVILVIINIASYNFFKRWDITEAKFYSLSDSSKDIVRSLDDNLTLEMYFGPDLPIQYSNLEQSVSDLLNEYASYSGHIKIKKIESDDLSKKTNELKIPKVQFNTYQKDKVEVVNGYLGLALKYQDKVEVIPVIQDVSNLEYQLSSLINKIILEDVVTIGFVNSNNSFLLDSDLTSVRDEIAKLYEIKQVNLNSDDPIDLSINTLIVPGPQAVMSEQELKKIDDFLMQGKSVLILADRLMVNQGLAYHDSANNISDLLSKYGIELDNKFILDASSGQASFNQGFLTFNLPYSLWPKILNKNFDQKNPMVANLEHVVLPWVTSLKIVKEKVSDEADIMYLAKSSKKAWQKDGKFDLNPQKKMHDNEELKQFNFIIGLKGKINSAYNDTSTDSGQLIVVADSDFIRNDFISRYPANMLLFQNIVDGLSLDSSLAEIRAKQIIVHPIKELTDNQKKWIRYANIFGVTILVIIIGIIRYYIRRRSNYFSLD